MSERSRYSLWLMPGEPAYGRYADLIGRLAQKAGSVAFQPHVTLLGVVGGAGDEPRARCAELAQQIEPAEIILRDIDYSAEYYRAITVRAELTESLSQARRRAVERCSDQPEAPYQPHLSLLYGDQADRKKRDLIDALLRQEGLQSTADLVRQAGASFLVAAVHLLDTGGEVRTWQVVQSLPLCG